MINMIINAMIELDEDKLKRLISRAIYLNFEKIEIMKAMDKSLDVIGKRFESEEYTMSDLMMAGVLYEEVLQTLDMYKPNEQNDHKKSVGTILLGTIEDDIHDIGKVVFKNAAITAGFRAIDLGVNVKPELFILRTKEMKPDILGISAILTSTRKHVIRTINLLKENNLRNNVKLVVGGGAFTEESSKDLDIDGFANDALKGVALCSQWIHQQ